MRARLYPCVLAFGLACGPTLAPLDGSDTGTSETTTGAEPTTREPTTLDTTTTTSTGDANSSGASTNDALTNFIESKDVNEDVVECDWWTGEPCEPGEKCMPWSSDGSSSWSGTRCSPIAPYPASAGEPCTVEEAPFSGIDDCEAFSMCWGVDPRTLQGICVAFCTGSEASPSCDQPCHTCSLTSSGVLGLCLSACDPLAQNCPHGQGCYGVAATFSCVPHAGVDEGGQPGDPCEYLNTCQPGSICANASAVDGCDGSPGCCAPFCDLTDASPCPSSSDATECVPWFEQAPPADDCTDFEHVGVCLLPS